MRVQLMLTCLCDALYGDVGAATVKALEHAGCVECIDPMPAKVLTLSILDIWEMLVTSNSSYLS